MDTPDRCENDVLVKGVFRRTGPYPKAAGKVLGALFSKPLSKLF